MSSSVLTPCVGICSTSSLGDAICRGCYRSSAEVREWNHIDSSHKAKIIARIDEFKNRVLSDFFVVTDIISLHQACLKYGVRVRLDVSPYYLLWDLMQRCHSEGKRAPWDLPWIVRLDLEDDGEGTDQIAGLSRSQLQAMSTEELWLHLYEIHWDFSNEHLKYRQPVSPAS